MALTPAGLIDIHCHLLPGLDDGPASGAEALALARLAAADGIATVIATPHQLGRYREVRAERIRAGVVQLQQVLQQHDVNLRILPGADVRIEPEVVEKIRSGEVLTVADRGRHVLLELPHEVCPPLDQLLAQLQQAGLCGILSHPERNLAIQAQPDLVGPLVESGWLIQITAASLTGTFGTRARGVAEWLVQHGWVHFVATDAHSMMARPPILSRAWTRVVELVGPDLAEQWFSTNPNAVIAGREVISAPRTTRKTAWFGWLRRRKAG